MLGRLIGYHAAGRYAETGRLYDEAIEFLRNPPTDTKQDPDYLQRVFSSVLAGAALTNLELNQPEKAESLARESLEIRERLVPDLWLRFTAQSLLGRALLRQSKIEEAEQHLLDGFAGIQELIDTIPANGRTRLLEACESLIKLYEKQGNEEQVEHCKQTLERLEISRGDSPSF